MRRLVLVLVCALPATAFADYVRVDRNANVYGAPSSDSAVLDRIRPQESDRPIYLIVASDALRNGYHKVYLREGAGTGWIYKSRVRKFQGSPPGTSRSDVYGGDPDHGQLLDEIIRLENTGYVVAYSETTANPVWVAYRLGPDQSHDCPRLRRFLVDDRTEIRVTHDAYNNTGYDRGHMAPSHNIGSRYGCAAQNETYRMSNITPQVPTLNQRPWAALEKLEASYAESFGEVWVMTGPIFDPVWLYRLCSDVEIPAAFYKIIVRQNDAMPDVLAVVFEQDTAPDVVLSTLVTTVDEIEQRTGIDFLAGLPDSVEEAVESARATNAVWRLYTALDTNFRPPTRETCTLPPARRDQVQ